MSKKTVSYLLSLFYLAPTIITAESQSYDFTHYEVSPTYIATALQWRVDPYVRCGGYYLSAAYLDAKKLFGTKNIAITSDQGMLYSLNGTSVTQGNVRIARYGQEIMTDKAYLYRQKNQKLSAIDLVGNVKLREPSLLIAADKGHINLTNRNLELENILYRIPVSNAGDARVEVPSLQRLLTETYIYYLTARGQAKEFKKIDKEIFLLKYASYTTCSPYTNNWEIRAKSILINKETGRGIAHHAQLRIKNIPVLYTPYLDFPIDDRRQTGFLTPTFGTSSNTGSLYFGIPYYLNLAPNYDLTIIPSYLSKRGFNLANHFRYLTPQSEGKLSFSILAHDQLFTDFKHAMADKFSGNTNPLIVGNLNQLASANTNRLALTWINETQWHERWLSHVNYNYVSDDYYLHDLGNITSNVKEVTQNQLLQLADLTYQGDYWNLLGRIQSFQTLNQLGEPLVLAQYRRLPQLALEGIYPEGWLNLNYFVNADATHFDIGHTPGIDKTNFPIGNRVHLQPGISYNYAKPYFYLDTRAQMALTQYDLVSAPNTNPTHINRALPIFDIHTGLFLERSIHLFKHDYTQTLEPELYYTYIPYKNQVTIPVFDTVLNTLNFDQLFVYNRFSGLDRFGDANQLAIGLTTRFNDNKSGFEKIRLALGQIIYFKNRQVTLCYNNNLPCQNDTSNQTRLSPLSAMFNFYPFSRWSFNATSIWDPNLRQFTNQAMQLNYTSGSNQVINLGFNYARGGEVFPGETLGATATNLSQTDLAFAWPLLRDWSVIGRWTQNWNHHHFQNLVYGLQYDSCCWAVRLVAGRTFIGLNPENNHTLQYDTQFFIQFALKGLGNIGTGDPAHFLNSSIPGYQNRFGQDF